MNLKKRPHRTEAEKRKKKSPVKEDSRPRPYNSKMPKMTHKVNIKQDYTRRNWELEMVI